MLITDPKNFFELMSQPRIGSYRKYFGHHLLDQEILGIYLWNECLCSSFFKILNLIEITSRNKFHKALSLHYFDSQKLRIAKRFNPASIPVQTIGSRISCNWYECALLADKSLSKILDKTHHPKFKTPLRKLPSPDDVIASLTLGFWCALVEKNPQFDWDDILLDVFPNHRYSKSFIFATRPPKQPLSNPWCSSKNTKNLYNRLMLINNVRNRIAHHEPLWKFFEIYDENYIDAELCKGNVLLPKSSNINETFQSLNLVLDRFQDTLSWMDTKLGEDYAKSSDARHLRWLLSPNGFDAYKYNGSNKGKHISKAIFKRKLSSLILNKNIFYFKDKNNIYALHRVT